MWVHVLSCYVLSTVSFSAIILQRLSLLIVGNGSSSVRMGHIILIRCLWFCLQNEIFSHCPEDQGCVGGPCTLNKVYLRLLKGLLLPPQPPLPPQGQRSCKAHWSGVAVLARFVLVFSGEGACSVGTEGSVLGMDRITEEWGGISYKQGR